MPTRAPNTALIRPGALGDTLLSAPMARAIRARADGGAVGLLAGRAVGRLLSETGAIDEALDIECSEWSRFFRADFRGSDLLAGYDRVACWYADPEGLLARNFARLGVAVRFVPPQPPADGADHAAAFWASALGDWASPPDLSMALDVPDAWRGASDVVLIHPGSGGRAKCWPIERFLRLADALHRAGRPCAFVTGPVEQERLGAPALQRLADAAPLTRCPDLSALALLLCQASAYVGNDSGPTHLAGLLGVRTLAIFVATSPTVWRPIGPRVSVCDGDVSADDVARKIVDQPDRRSDE